MPVTVTVAGPVVAVLEAASVNVELVPVVEVGLNVAVTPLGRLLEVNATLPAKLPVRVTVTVLVPLAPRLTVRLVGFAKSEKSGALTVRLIVVVCTSAPLVPVTVTVAGPAVAVLEAARVSVEVVPVVEAASNEAVTPPGKPLAVRATLPANPPLREIAMVLVPFAPRLRVRLDGAADRAKSGLAVPEGSPTMIPRPLVLT